MRRHHVDAEPAKRSRVRPPVSNSLFQVENIAAAYQALVGRGVAFIDAPHVVHRDSQMELWMAFFKDLDQNVMAIREARRLG